MADVEKLTYLVSERSRKKFASSIKHEKFYTIVNYRIPPTVLYFANCLQLSIHTSVKCLYDATELKSENLLQHFKKHTENQNAAYICFYHQIIPNSTLLDISEMSDLSSQAECISQEVTSQITKQCHMILAIVGQEMVAKPNGQVDQTLFQVLHSPFQLNNTVPGNFQPSNHLSSLCT